MNRAHWLTFAPPGLNVAQRWAKAAYCPQRAIWYLFSSLGPELLVRLQRGKLLDVQQREPLRERSTRPQHVVPADVLKARSHERVFRKLVRKPVRRPVCKRAGKLLARSKLSHVGLPANHESGPTIQYEHS
ncbi:MAG: hypothetical protein ACUVTH_04715 [Thermogutta sp.]